MEKRNLNFEVNKSSELIKMMTGALMDCRRGVLDFETVKGITLIADKINKAVSNEIEYKKVSNHKNNLEFLE